MTGVIHGQTIELESDPGIPEGETVQVVMKVATKRTWGEGIRKSAGGWSDISAEVDAVCDEIQQARKLERRPQDLDECG